MFSAIPSGEKLKILKKKSTILTKFLSGISRESPWRLHKKIFMRLLHKIVQEFSLEIFYGFLQHYSTGSFRDFHSISFPSETPPGITPQVLLGIRLGKPSLKIPSEISTDYRDSFSNS